MKCTATAFSTTHGFGECPPWLCIVPFVTPMVSRRKWMDSQSHGTNYSQFSPNSIADVFAKFADAKTFGLDGFCHGPTPFIGP